MEELFALHLSKMAPSQRTQYWAFLRWVNFHLARRSMPEINFLEEALEDGLVLMVLLEELSNKPFSGFSNTNRASTIHRIDNLTRCFTFMRAEKINLPAFSPEDVANKTLRFVFGVMWAIFLHFHILSLVFTDGQSRGTLFTKSRLLELVRELTGGSCAPSSFDDPSFCDGSVFLALLHRYQPSLVDASRPGAPPVTNPAQRAAQLELALRLFEEHLDVPRLLRAEDMMNGATDQTTMLLYASLCLRALLDARGGLGPDGRPLMFASGGDEAEQQRKKQQYQQEEQVDDIINSIFQPPAGANQTPHGSRIAAAQLSQSSMRLTIRRQTAGEVGVPEFDELIRNMPPATVGPSGMNPAIQSNATISVATTGPIKANLPMHHSLQLQTQTPSSSQALQDSKNRKQTVERMRVAELDPALQSFDAPSLQSCFVDLQKLRLLLEDLASHPASTPANQLFQDIIFATALTPPPVLTPASVKAAADSIRELLRPLDTLLKNVVRIDDAREVDRLAVGVPLFAANLVLELSKAAARLPAFDLNTVIALSRRLIVLSRTAVGVTQNGIVQFELVSYAKNFLIQSVQLVVVVGVLYQNLDKLHASGSHTLDNAVKNVINALRKLVFLIHSATEQELQQKRLLRGLMNELDRKSSAGPTPSETSLDRPAGKDAPGNVQSLRTDPTPQLLSELAALKAAASAPAPALSHSSTPATIVAQDGSVTSLPLPAKKLPNKQMDVIRAPKKRGSVLTKRLSMMVQRDKNAPVLPPGVTLGPPPGSVPSLPVGAALTITASSSTSSTASEKAPLTSTVVTLQPERASGSSGSADSASSVAKQLDLRLPPKLNLSSLMPPPTVNKGSSIRRSARTPSAMSPRAPFQRLIQSVATDCRELLLSVRVPFDEFKTHNQQKFQLLTDGLLANHKLALDKVAGQLGEGEVMKHNLVSSAKLDLAANDVVQSRTAAQFEQAVRGLKTALKDFLAAVKSCTQLQSGASAVAPAAQKEPAVKPSSAANYTILPLSNPNDRRMSNPPLPSLSNPSTRVGSPRSPVGSPRSPKYSPLQIFSQHAKDLTLAFKHAEAGAFHEQFNFDLITALFKSVQRLLASPSFPDHKAKKKCLEETKRMLGYARQIKTAMDSRNFQAFRRGKHSFLTSLKVLLQTIVAGMKHSKDPAAEKASPVRVTT